MCTQVVGRIKASYARLPQKAYTCPKGSEKRDNAPCYTPGPSVEAAYSAMMKELRKASTISTGDFRKVELVQF